MSQTEQQAQAIEALAQQAEAEDYTPPPEDLKAQPGQPAPQAPDVGEMMAGVLVLGFGLMASRRGEHWNLTEPEARELGSAIGAVCDHYFPGMQMGPLPALAVVAGVVIGPRVMQDLKTIEPPKDESGGGNGDQ